jgi:DNA-binding MarR family transcriptional regulator
MAATPTPTQMNEIIDLFRLVLQSARDTDRLVNAWLERELHITSQDLSVLHSVALGHEYPTEIASRLNQASPTISHVISRLVGKDLIEREKGTDDGRRRRLQLTQRGTELLERAHEILDKAMHDGHFNLDPKAVKRTQSALDKYMKIMRFSA